ncbi:MAG: HAMP domain-containing sensor histidine kinase [candidate division WOR-3 bacterium]
MKGELSEREGLTLIVHEIKNSLSGLKMGLGMLSESKDKEVKEISEALLEELEYLRDITLDFLSLSGQFDLKLEEVDIEKLARESARIVIGNNNHVFFNFSEDFPQVLCDKNLIKSVLINLINNAYEEVGEEGKIEVGGRKKEGNMVEFWVKDNGKGIKGDVNSIFKKFKSRKKGGIGIGLYLVRKIVYEHFGKINVESIYGKGTKFIIEMPRDFHFVDRRSGKERRQIKGRRKEDG